jgi:hypothetical protein
MCQEQQPDNPINSFNLQDLIDIINEQAEPIEYEEEQEQQEEDEELINNPFWQEIVAVIHTEEFNEAYRNSDVETLKTILMDLNPFRQIYDFVKARKDGEVQFTNNELSLLVQERFFSDESEFEYKNLICFSLTNSLDLILCDGKGGGFNLAAYGYPKENDIVNLNSTEYRATNVGIFTFELEVVE